MNIDTSKRSHSVPRPRADDAGVNKIVVRWIALVAVLFVVDLVNTISTHNTYHHQANGPSVMPIGELLGWVTSAGLFVVLLLLVIGQVKAVRRHRQGLPRR